MPKLGKGDVLLAFSGHREFRGAVKHPTNYRTASTTKNYLAQMSIVLRNPD